MDRYLDQVIPQANTVRKSPLFCFKPLLRLLKKNGKDRAEDEEVPNIFVASVLVMVTCLPLQDLAVDESIQELGDEDEDVVEEVKMMVCKEDIADVTVHQAQRARDSNFPCVLRVKGMKKVYSSDGRKYQRRVASVLC